MTLWLHVHGGYPSYKDSGAPWKQAEYDAYKFVRALKGKDFNGYATMRSLSNVSLTFTAKNRAPAFRIFSEWAAAKLAELGLAGDHLMAVPASDCLALGGDPKGRALCDAIAARAKGFTTIEGLHWGEQLQKASEGGTRNPDELYGNLYVINSLPPRHIVLVDDVATSGGHLKACARALRHFGHTVEHALCAAQTVHSRPDAGMFSLSPIDLEANPFEVF